jgi:hypothetical protein
MVSMLVLVIVGAIQLVLLLGIAARHDRERTDGGTDQGWGVHPTDEVDVVAAYAEAATAAAERAQLEAEQAQHQAMRAAAARDIAGQRHRLAVRRAEAAGDAHELVQRAALDAYRRRQLTVAELNRIWHHAQVMAESTPHRATMPLGWELRVREARTQHVQAVVEAARAEEDARLKGFTAATLAEEARAAESLLAAARHSASTGLVGLLRATWVGSTTG